MLIFYVRFLSHSASCFYMYPIYSMHWFFLLYVNGLLFFFEHFYISLFYYLVCMSRLSASNGCVSRVCLVPPEARGGHQLPQGWRDR